MALETAAEKLAADLGEEKSVDEALLRRWGYKRINAFLHGAAALSLVVVEQMQFTNHFAAG